MLEKKAEMLGASPTQYRYLLNTEKIVEKRALHGQRGTGLSPGFSVFSALRVQVLSVVSFYLSGIQNTGKRRGC